MYPFTMERIFLMMSPWTGSPVRAPSRSMIWKSGAAPTISSISEGGSSL
jgi:hypothetical protein